MLRLGADLHIVRGLKGRQHTVVLLHSIICSVSLGGSKTHAHNAFLCRKDTHTNKSKSRCVTATYRESSWVMPFLALFS